MGVRVLFLGDIALLNDCSVKALSSTNLKDVSKCDYVVANLEAPVGKGKPAKHKVNISSHSRAIKAVKKAGVDAVNLSNNHILDYGYGALRRTVDQINNEGLSCFGISKRGANKRKRTYKIKGTRVALLGYVSDTTSPVLPARGELGPNRLAVGKAIKDIRSVSDISDCVVVNIHWGYQNYHYPSPNQRCKARELIDAGADIVIGHHAHTYQAYEKYADGIIFYGLGNLVFPNSKHESYYDGNGNFEMKQLTWNERNNYSILPVVDIDAQKENVNIEQIYVSYYDTNEDRLSIEKGESYEEIMSHLRKVSAISRLPFYKYVWIVLKRIENARILFEAWNNSKKKIKLRHIKIAFKKVVNGTIPESSNNG